MIGAASMVPALFFGPIAGATADRYGHRRQLVCAATTGATAAFIMAAFTLVGLMNEELLLGLASIGGTTRAFTVPARNAMVHDLVEKSHLSAAIGVNAARDHLHRCRDGRRYCSLGGIGFRLYRLWGRRSICRRAGPAPATSALPAKGDRRNQFLS